MTTMKKYYLESNKLHLKKQETNNKLKKQEAIKSLNKNRVFCLKCHIMTCDINFMS